MKTISKLTLALLMVLIYAHGSLAQDEAKKYDNPKWKRIVYIDFETGKYSEAMDIVENKFMKATEKAGTSGPEMILEMNTGEWDIMVVWHMDGGVADMDWEVSPDQTKWMAAMKEMMPDDAEREELMANYRSMIRKSKSEIARVR